MAAKTRAIMMTNVAPHFNHPKPSAIIRVYRYVFSERQTCLVTLVGSRRKFELMSPGALTDEGVCHCTEYSAEEYSTVDSITDDEGVEYSADNAHHAPADQEWEYTLGRRLNANNSTFISLHIITSPLCAHGWWHSFLIFCSL